MESQKPPTKPSSKSLLFVILGLPVLAAIAVIGFGVYSQWDEITPRWKDKRAPTAELPANSSSPTNQPTANPAPE
jgi:hypothetical protein